MNNKIHFADQLLCKRLWTLLELAMLEGKDFIYGFEDFEGREWELASTSYPSYHHIQIRLEGQYQGFVNVANDFVSVPNHIVTWLTDGVQEYIAEGWPDYELE